VSSEQGQVPTLQWTASRPIAQATALDLLRQDTLGEFEILAELGRGGMATVYLAHDIPLDRKVAIKVMSAALMDEGLAERFRREARTAAALNHPHIIPVYAVRERSGLLYFVMKFIPGQSLDPIVKSGAPISIPMAHVILAQAAAALGYAHRRGVIHRDVKPANIMLDDEGWVVMTDFGIAKVATATGLTMTGVTVGTPAYMSPEQCAGKEVTGASDQYSLGVLAYELITGQKPFTATTAMAMMYSHFNDTPAPLRSLRPDCPPELEEKVLRMLAKAPEDRWQSIEEIFGAPSLAHDDPNRKALVNLALSSSQNAAIAGAISSPTSPVPPARRSATTVAMAGPGSATSRFGEPPAIPVSGASTPAPGRRPIPRPDGGNRTSTIAIGATAAAALVVAGYFALRNRPATSALPPDSMTPPVSSAAPDTVRQVDTAKVVVPVPAPESLRATPPAPQPEAPPPAVTLASVRATTSSVDLEIGKSTRVAAQVFGSDGNLMRQHPAIGWRSSAPRIASVARDGTIRALTAGTASVIASVSGRSDTIAVRVTAAYVAPPPVVAAAPETTVAPPPTVANVGLSEPNTPLKVGESVLLALSVRDTRGNTLTDRRASWESSDPAIASVVNGTVTARAAGSATITATVEGRSATARVTVATPPDPAADRARATTEIAAQLSAFAAAIEKRDVSDFKQVLTSAQYQGWEQMLGQARLRRVGAEFQALEAAKIEQTTASQRVRLKLQRTVAGEPASNTESNYLARFEHSDGKWRLTQLRPD
jgi:serine/threonine-protein kinase